MYRIICLGIAPDLPRVVVQERYVDYPVLAAVPELVYQTWSVSPSKQQPPRTDESGHLVSPQVIDPSSGDSPSCCCAALGPVLEGAVFLDGGRRSLTGSDGGLCCLRGGLDMLGVAFSRSTAGDPWPQRVTESMPSPPVLPPPRFLNLKAAIDSPLPPLPPTPPASLLSSFSFYLSF